VRIISSFPFDFPRLRLWEKHPQLLNFDRILASTHIQDTLHLSGPRVDKLWFMSDLEGHRYELNRKHKETWQPGRKGTLCPKWSHDLASTLLHDSVPALKGNHRYATINGIAFCGQEHSPGKWHGYPIGWEAVPPKIVNRWRREGKITRKQIRDSWEEARLSSDE
jgi:hypothetical protein